MYVWRFGLTIPKLLVMDSARNYRFNGCFEAAVVFDLIINGSNISVWIFHSVTTLDASVEALTFPVIQRDSIRLVDIITKRIIDLDLEERDK